MNPVAPVTATRIASLDVIQPAAMAALVVPRTSFLLSQEFTQKPLAQHLSDYLRGCFTDLWVTNVDNDS